MFLVVCACVEHFDDVGHFTERSGFLERKADDLQKHLTAVISERGVVFRTKRTGPSTEL